MTDRYERIRRALEMGPTPGPWGADGFEVMAARGQFYGGLILGADDVVVAQMVSAANAPLIAACDPDTIRELLAERDQLAAAIEAAREDGERWRQAFVDERASRYRADGMKIEQARIHAETDAEVAAIDQARGKGGCGEGVA